MALNSETQNGDPAPHEKLPVKGNEPMSTHRQDPLLERRGVDLMPVLVVSLSLVYVVTEDG